MKTRLLIIFVIAISSLLGYVQYVDARCSPNEDWPDAPCYGCPGCYPGLEQEKIRWEPYYDFKGKEFMELKLHQLQTAVNDNMLQDWIDNSPIPQERENVRYYYFLKGVVPDYHGMYFDQALEQENMNKLWEIVNLEFIDFAYANKIGESIQFVLEKTAYNNCNSYDAKITDKDTNLVWGEVAEALCDPNQNPSLIASYIKIGNNEDNPIIINESGKYYIEFEIGNMFTKKEFVVKQNHGGIHSDPKVYPVPWETQSPLKQIKSGITIDEVQCKEFLIRMAKHDGSPACVTESTAPKLSDRGWSWVLDLELWEEGYVLISPTIYEIKTDEGSYGGQYQNSGSSIDSISYDQHGNSLIILMNSPERGILQIVVPSGLLHSVTQEPWSYFVLANNEEIDFEELSPIILKIAFDSGTERLEIIGTFP